MRVGRRLLVVVYDYPPSPSIGAVRWWTMTKYLAQLGHSVTVVTSDSFGVPADADPVQVLRPRSLATSWPFSRLARHPNPRVSWAPFALREARRLLREESFECVITTSPPESAHLVGLMLGDSRPPWVADFRDGWCFEPYTTRFRARALLALDCWLERRVALAAEVVVGATPPIADDLAQRLGARAHWIPNGWDPAAADDDERPSPMPAGAGLTLVYTGRMSGLLGRTPEALLRALKLLQSTPSISRFRFVHAGPLTAEDRSLIERTGVSEMVEHLGSLDRASALALQRSADVLVLITSRHSSEATGKLFEYLAAGRPILALAEGNEAERIVQETRTGVVVPPDDVDAIADALRRAARGELERDYAPRGVERYSYPGLAEEAVEAIEQAIALRASK
jgi:glycosyltransferase involved in cell wall biosynthesis